MKETASIRDINAHHTTQLPDPATQNAALEHFLNTAIPNTDETNFVFTTPILPQNTAFGCGLLCESIAAFAQWLVRLPCTALTCITNDGQAISPQPDIAPQ